MDNHAFRLKSQSRNIEAISLMERGFKLQKGVLGLKHPDTEILLEALQGWQDRLVIRLPSAISI